MRALRGLLVTIVVCALAGCSEHASRTTQPEPPASSAAPEPGGDLLTEVRRRGTLIIATDANYSPQSMRALDGTWSGFDVDVGREIAKRLGVKPVFKAVAFDVIVKGHWLDQWDVDIGSMSVTSERTKVLWFSKPYYYVPGSIAVRRSSDIYSLDDLKGKNVGVTAATTFQSYLQGKLAGKVSVKKLGVTPVPYDNDIHALRDVAYGNDRAVEAVLTSLPTIHKAIADGLPVRVVGDPVFGDRPAVALDRDSTHESLALLFAIDVVVDSMHRDGTLRQLSRKYYGMDLSGG